MALAIRMEDLIRAGGIADYSELAQLGRVSRARITQIMNLLVLAPDIQERILFLSQPAGVATGSAGRIAADHPRLELGPAKAPLGRLGSESVEPCSARKSWKKRSESA